MEPVPGLIQSPPARQAATAGYDADIKRDAEIVVPFTVDKETYPLPQISPPPWTPGQDLVVLIYTWNMAQETARAAEVREHGIRPIAHIIVVSTQENGPYVGTNDAHAAWRSMVVSACLGGHYDVVGEGSQWALHMLVLARKSDVAKYCREGEVGACKTGELAGLMGNKGGIGIGLRLSLRRSSMSRAGAEDNAKQQNRDDDFSPRELIESTAPVQRAVSKPDLSLLFIGAHLTAHQQNTVKRNEDYLRIVQELPVGSRGAYAEKFTATFSLLGCRDVTEEYDVSMFAGDLNYRIKGTKTGIEFIVKNHKSMRAVLVANDQLTAERKKGLVFHNFCEGELHFRPTYKYHIDKFTKRTADEYDFSAKKPRQPSFTDRVLYKRGSTCLLPIELVLYTDCPEVRSSDHRPVVALFKLSTSLYADEGPEPPAMVPKQSAGLCC
jgi:hypothetical protein